MRKIILYIFLFKLIFLYFIFENYIFYIFTLLGSSLKSDRETINKIKDMASKAGLKTEVIKEKYIDNFNDYIIQFWNEFKKDIIDKAKTNPEILKVDPVWMEKLNTGEGLQEYILTKNVTITPENVHQFPELNQMFLDTDPSNVNKSFADLYFSGIINEDNMRTYPHYTAMKNYLNTFEEEVQKTLTPTNEMWVSKLKDDTYNYIKLVMSPEFQEESTSYAKTLDNMRLDLGLVISRDPIFIE